MKKEKQAQEDRISNLPDCLIQHILSFLPSTEECVRTSVLSKRWNNQWTYVPVLIFRYTSTISNDRFGRLVDNTLVRHNCQTISKFHLDLCREDDVFPCLPQTWFTARILFAIRKFRVKELILKRQTYGRYTLPEFLCNNSSLLKLNTSFCSFKSKVNWSSLKTLKIEPVALFPLKTIEDVLSGCPVLEYLKLYNCRKYFHFGFVEFPLAIRLKSLKRLHLQDIEENTNFEISCPNLEELILDYFSGEIESMDLPALVRASLRRLDRRLITRILEQLQHVKELNLDANVIKTHLASELKGQLFHFKCSLMTIDNPLFVDHLPAIAFATSCSPFLEGLVVNLDRWDVETDLRRVMKLGDFSKSYWDSNEYAFNCLVSSLKTVKITGVWREAFEFNCLVLQFIEFLLKNARVLQTLVVVLRNNKVSFESQLQRKLLSFPRASPHTVVAIYST